MRRKVHPKTGRFQELHKHHTLPVGASVEHIDWHLRHLFDGGWKTIVMLTPTQHIEYHRTHGYEKFSKEYT